MYDLMNIIFPNGISHYLLGGVLIGLAVMFVYLYTGIFSGASSILHNIISYFSNTSFFKQTKYLNTRNAKVIFGVGLFLGGLLFMLFSGRIFSPEVSIWRILIGSFLVGFGVRMSKGCTSGHGICGLSSFSLTSGIAVVVFLVIAIITANLVGVIFS